MIIVARAASRGFVAVCMRIIELSSQLLHDCMRKLAHASCACVRANADDQFAWLVQRIQLSAELQRRGMRQANVDDEPTALKWEQSSARR
eukprot:6204295-Pleurochrysis_carterae.AAC.1